MGKISKATRYVLIAAAVVLFLPPFVKYQEMRWKNRGLQQRIAEQKRQEKRMLEEKRRLETDITYIEQKAREKIGVVRKGEIVLKEVPYKKK